MRSFLFALLVVVCIFAANAHAALPNEQVNEPNPFVRMLSDSDKAKLELAADMAALHHKVLELTQKLPPYRVPHKRPNVRGVVADQIGFLPMQPPSALLETEAEVGEGVEAETYAEADADVVADAEADAEADADADADAEAQAEAEEGAQQRM